MSVAAKRNEAVVIWCTSGLHDIINIRAAKWSLGFWQDSVGGLRKTTVVLQSNPKAGTVLPGHTGSCHICQTYWRQRKHK